MKLLKAACIAFLLILNLAVVKPALADAPKPTESADYTNLVETLSGLIQARDTNTPPEGMTIADVEQKIPTLEYQKYLMEMGEDTLCRNNTTRPLAVYGSPNKGSTTTFEQVLYLLPAGEETDDNWVCGGVYLPNDATAAGLELMGATAVKILPGTELEIAEDPDTGAIAFNLPPASVFSAGDINWEIPDLAQADLTNQYPEAPLD
ncbi:hypothetical protein ACQ4M4_11780 [Leptolyngbya sp. AN02str]|uniref:hypothetical protein n=1 Tax=Leptolyngbya sp. AN02str TaxID=3423363 RepID=UPI003D32025E